MKLIYHSEWDDVDREISTELMTTLLSHDDYLTFESYKCLPGLGEYFELKNVTFHKKVYLQETCYTRSRYGLKDMLYEPGSIVPTVIAQSMKREIPHIETDYIGLRDEYSSLSFMKYKLDDYLWSE